MQHIIRKKYLVFPVNRFTGVKRLSLQCEGEDAYRLDIRIDNRDPIFRAYIDVSRWIGRKIEIGVAPEMPLHFEEADTISVKDLYREDSRPQLHFTTKNGWTNDPNGLVYLNGVYHLFYQYNPCDSIWGNMHWGHAVSTDLLHWEERNIALFPDRMGTVFSGCAVVDRDNRLGLQRDGTPTMVLFYTAASNPFTQCMAYSTDAGQTFVKYADNPVIPQLADHNRDPKVVWCAEKDCYVMALYLTGRDFRLLTSEDLIHWMPLQDVTLEGDGECPDLFCLCDEKGERYWVLIGAHDRYRIGQVKDGRFVFGETTQTLHFGRRNYASQTFSNLPDGRIVRIAWNSNLGMHSDAVTQQMGFPTEMTMKIKNGVPYLCSQPIREIAALTETEQTYAPLTLSAGGEWRQNVPIAPLRLQLKTAVTPHGRTVLRVFGSEIVLDFERRELLVGQAKGPLTLTENTLQATVLIDRWSAEISLEDGAVCFTESFPCDYNLPYLSLSDSEDRTLDSLTVTVLRSIWSEDR